MQQKKTMDGELKHERPPINFSFLFYRSDLFQILGRKTQTSLDEERWKTIPACVCVWINQQT
jgi:hypothetical protein